MTREVVLVNEVHGADRRHVSARIDAQGCLVVEGQERGPQVSDFWGDDITESEWSWTVACDDLSTLASALKTTLEDLLPTLARRFSGAALAGLQPFFAAAGVRVERWSRLGD